MSDIVLIHARLDKCWFVMSKLVSQDIHNIYVTNRLDRCMHADNQSHASIRTKAIMYIHPMNVYE